MATFDVSTSGFDALEERLNALEERVTDTASWVVGTRVEYAVYLEFGTRHMDPKPFLRPAVQEAKTNTAGFIRKNTKLTLADIDSAEELVQTLALALERRIKEIITEKDLIETGTLRASIAAVPSGQRDAVPTADDIDFNENDNPVDAGPIARQSLEVSG
jgi:hypothetical protein